MSQAIWMAAAEEARQKKKLIIQRKVLREKSSPLTLPDDHFIRYFRLNKSLFRVLCGELIPHMDQTRRCSAVRPELKILAALAFYGHGSYQKSIAAFFHLGLSQPKVSQCVTEVTRALNSPEILLKYIQFPRTTVEREAVARRFMELHGFPGVIGCVDGTHVAIIRPQENEEAFFNRKQYHSLNVMIICDADLRIIHVDASFGGQSHDSHIWNSSPILAVMQNLNSEGERCWLLGDSGYAQRPWLMTPILNASPNSPEEFYTYNHVRTRNVVERCIGVLKARWRSLLAHRVLHYTPIKAGSIVNACVVLHNLINNSNIQIDDEEIRNDAALQPVIRRPVQENVRFAEERQDLINRLWTGRN